MTESIMDPVTTWSSFWPQAMPAPSFQTSPQPHISCSNRQVEFVILLTAIMIIIKIIVVLIIFNTFKVPGIVLSTLNTLTYLVLTAPSGRTLISFILQIRKVRYR